MVESASTHHSCLLDSSRDTRRNDLLAQIDHCEERDGNDANSQLIEAE